MMYKISYPNDVNDVYKKLSFCYSLKRKLHQEHNETGKKVVSGELSKREWDEYKSDWYERSEAIETEILRLRDEIAKLNNHNISKAYDYIVNSE